MRTLVSIFIAAYLGLNFIVFVFHPFSGPFLSLSHVALPAGIVDGRPIWYPRVVTFAKIARAEEPTMRKREALDLGLAEAVYESRVKGVLRTAHAQVPARNAEDPLVGVLTLSQSANTAVFASADLQADVKQRLAGLRTRITGEGLPFTDAAMRYSEHSSAKLSGDLGVMSKERTPDWMISIFNLTTKTVSEATDGPDAYWLFFVQSFSGQGTDSAAARVSAIAFQKKELPVIITKLAKNDRPWIFVW